MKVSRYRTLKENPEGDRSCKYMSDGAKPKRQKAGRKPKPASKREKSRTTVRATDQEWTAIKKRAAASGRSISRYLVAVGTRDGQPATQEEREELGRILFELHKAGTNLNQIAHTLNAARLSGAAMPGAAEVTKAIADVRSTVAAARERLKA